MHLHWLWLPLLLGATGCYRIGMFRTEQLLASQGEVGPCDAILVPGCPALPDGRPSTCVARRVGAAVEAWRAGLAEVVIFSGAAVHNEANEAQAMGNHARLLGLPEAALLLEPTARHTTDNVRFAAELVRARGGRRVLIVTDAFQLPFAVDMARRRGLEAYGRLAHPPFRRHRVRRELELDRWEPLPVLSWY